MELNGLINRQLTMILFDDDTRYGYFADNLGNQYKIPYPFYADGRIDTENVYVLANNRPRCLLADIKEGDYFTVRGALFRKKTNVENPDDWEDIVTDSTGCDMKMHIEVPVLRFQ